MRTAKLILLLQTFEPSEIRAFDKFVKSGYFNYSPSVLNLWRQLKKIAPKFDEKELGKEKIFRKVFKGEKFDNEKLRQLMSRLLKLVEKFLIIEDLEKKEVAYKLATAHVYRQKGLKEEYKRIYTKQLDNFSKEAFLTPQAIYQKSSLHHQLYFNEFNVKGDNCSTNLIESTRLLEKYYYHQKLVYTLEWLSCNLRYEYDIPQSILKNIEVLKEKPIIEKKEGIAYILTKAIQLLLLPNDTLFEQVKSQFSDHYPVIDEKNKNLIFRLLINYCINKGDKGTKVTKEIFQLYELGLKDGAIFYKGLMTNATFINIVSNALKLKKTEWTKSFIKNESLRLYEQQKTLFICLANALILFHESKYQDCLMMLTQLEKFDLITLEVPKRNLQLRTIFECYKMRQLHVKSLYAQLENYQKYLQRKSILSANKRKAYQSFGRFLLRLVKWFENEGNEKQLTQLKQDLIDRQPFPNTSKEWLLCHIEDILKNRNGVDSATPFHSILIN